MTKEVKVLVDAIENKKGSDIVVIDISEKSSIADYFVICTGNSEPNIRAISDEAEDKMAEIGIMRRGIEGYGEARWVLMDFGDVILHIFNEETRGFYDIEQLWNHAKVVFRG